MLSLFGIIIVHYMYTAIDIPATDPIDIYFESTGEKKAPIRESNDRKRKDNVK